MTIERIHYYERQYLSAIDFAAEQDYHRDARRRHNVGQHTWSIVVGLELEERTEGGQLSVYVLPGFATDGYGREIVLTSPYKLDGLLFDRFNTLAHRKVWIAYEETDAQPPAFGFDVCAVDNTMRRTVEGFRIVVDPTGDTRDAVIVDGVPTNAPPSPPVPGTLYLPPDESTPYQELPDDDDGDPLWLVRLGTVQWDGANTQFVPAAPGRLNEERRYAGVVATEVLTPTPELRIRSRMAPVPADALEFARVEGPLRVTGRLVAEQDVFVDGGHVRYNYLSGDTDDVDLWMQRQRGPSDVGHRLRVHLGDKPGVATTLLSIGPASGADEQVVLSVRADDVVDVPTGTLRFGAQVRQMVDLWDSADKPGKAPYGVGVQSGTLYQRTGNQFCWFRGGEHDDGASQPGTGGFLQMRLDDVGRLHLLGDGTDKQAVNLLSASTGFGTQPGVLYVRSPGGFAWYRGGSHSSTAYDPGGGGTIRMRLDGGGDLSVFGDLAASGNFTAATGGDGWVRTRHVRGKSAASDADDNLYLNWHSGRDVVVGNPGGNAANLHVAGDLAVYGNGDAAFRTRTYTLRRKNTDPPWHVDLTPDFNKVFAAFVVMHGFSIWDNTGDPNFSTFDHVVDPGAVVQHCYVRITNWNDSSVDGVMFCSEASLPEGDNTILFTVVVFGRKR